MIEHATLGRRLQKNSRYYLDPSEKNGEVKVLKPADPKKLKELRKLTSRRNRPNAARNSEYVLHKFA